LNCLWLLLVVVDYHVPQDEAVSCELRMLKQLFKSPTPGMEITADGPKKKNFLEDLHPNSLKPIPDALVERRCHGAAVETVFQFERIGYFVVDPDSRPSKTVFNRTVSTKATKIKY
jgi:glutaminyl-tRNA synthetase